MHRAKKITPQFQLRYDPAEIPRLVNEYMSTPYKGRTAGDEDRDMGDAGKRILSGEATRENAELIYKWKSARRIDQFRKNTDHDIEQAIRTAICAKAVTDTIVSLTYLKGVGVKMASAIITAIFPANYTVLDFRALEALGVGDAADVNFYVCYLEACRSMAREYSVTLRDFDRANWQWSSDRAKRAKSC